MTRVAVAVILAALATAAEGFRASSVRPARPLARRSATHMRLLARPAPADDEAKAAVATASAATQAATDFRNDGAFAWMLPYMEVIGWKPGQTLYGAMPVHTDATVVVPPAAVAARRDAAAEALQNIGSDERARRAQLGTAFAAVALVYATWASLLADDGGLTGHLLRLGLVVPLFLAEGFQVSAEEGL
jgi:hypothetical protein